MRTRPSLIWLLMIAVSLPGAALADKYDYEFANALAVKRRYYDLAREQFKQLAESGRTEQARLKGKFGIAEILIIQARREIDPQKKVEAFDKALAAMAEIVRSSDKLVDGKFKLANAYVEKANIFLKRAEKDGDRDGSLKGQARTAFDSAIKLFGEVVKATAESENEDVQLTYRRSRYMVIECKFEKAVTWKLGDNNRNVILKGLQEEIESFCWDHEDYIEAYYAYTILGQALANLNSRKQPAYEDLEEAWGAFEAALGIPVEEWTDFCRTLAYSRFLAELNRFGFYEQALARAKTMREEYPQLEAMRSPFAQSAAIEEAKANWGAKKQGPALAIIGRIARMRTLAGAKAQLLLGKWQERTGAKKTPSEAYLIAEGFRRERSWWLAIRAFQETITATEESKNPEDKKKYLADAWVAMAYCFGKLALNYESFYCLREASAAALEAGDRNSAGEYAYLAYTKIAGRANSSKSQADKDSALKARDYFVSNFPKSPYIPGIRLQEAKDKEYAKDYAKAISLFKQIPKANQQFYEVALARIGICYYKQMRDLLVKENKLTAASRGLAKQSQAAIADYMAYIKTVNVPDKAKEERNEVVALVTYYLGSVHDKLEQPAKVIEVLKGFETKFGKMVSANRIGAGIVLRLKAAIDQAMAARKAKDADGAREWMAIADREIATMEAVARGTRYYNQALQRLGYAYALIGNEAEKANEGAGRADLDKGLNLLVQWAQRSRDLKYEDLKYVAVSCFNQGRDGDPVMLRNAAAMFDKMTTQYGDKAVEDGMTAYLAECYFLAEEWDKASQMLEGMYRRNCRDLFAIRSLGRCYFEMGKRAKGNSADLQRMILNSHKEDLILVEAMKNPPKASLKDSITRDVVWRASQLYSGIQEAKGKPELTRKQYTAFQSAMLKKSEAQIESDFKALVNQYYHPKMKAAKAESDKAKLRMQEAAFAFNRCLFYYRIVGSKSARGEAAWRGAKYHVIAAHLHRGKAYSDAANGNGSSKEAKLAKEDVNYAQQLLQNLATLYPKFAGPTGDPKDPDQERRADWKKMNALREEIKQAKQLLP